MTAKRLKQFEDRGLPFLPLTRPVPFNLESDEDYIKEMTKRDGRDPKE